MVEERVQDNCLLLPRFNQWEWGETKENPQHCLASIKKLARPGWENSDETSLQLIKSKQLILASFSFWNGCCLHTLLWKTTCLPWICFRKILHLVTFYCVIYSSSYLTPSGVPIRVQNLKDGTVHDKPLDIYLYLNKMGSVEQGVGTITFFFSFYIFFNIK